MSHEQHGVARRTRRSANMGVTNSDDRETENPLRGKTNSVNRDGDNGVAQRKRTMRGYLEARAVTPVALAQSVNQR